MVAADMRCCCVRCTLDFGWGVVFCEGSLLGFCSVSFSQIKVTSFPLACHPQDIGFQHVLMSGSGSTLFCIGSPSHSSPWVEDFTKKWGAMVVDTQFINRPVDAHAWYTEA